jgi:hypothetical protein
MVKIRKFFPGAGRGFPDQVDGPEYLEVLTLQSAMKILAGSVTKVL